MKSIGATTFAAFDEIVETLTASTLCRGVSNEAHELKPSLFRRADTEDFDGLERDLMWLFKTQARPHVTRLPASELEWLVLAQHHGVPTRLLDWTLSPLVALFFAVQSLSETNAAVYLYERRKFKREERINLSTLAVVAAFFPSHNSPRVTAQQGMFTVHPTSHLTLIDDEITKVVIPAGAKKQLMGKLAKYGVHDATIFPDLDGLARFLRRIKLYK